MTMNIDKEQIQIIQNMLTPTGADLDSEVFDRERFNAIMKSICGIEKNSLTTSPAVGIKAVLHSANMREVQLAGSVQQDKRLITSVKMVPDLLISAIGPDGQPAFDQYSPSAIYHARNKFMMSANVHGIDWEHTGPNLRDIYLVESWLVEDPVHDKLNSMGFTKQFQDLGFDGIPKGTWAVTYFVPNDQLWAELKTNSDRYGFSIMGYFHARQAKKEEQLDLLTNAVKLSQRDDLDTAEKLTKLLTLMKT